MSDTNFLYSHKKGLLTDGSYILFKKKYIKEWNPYHEWKLENY